MVPLEKCDQRSKLIDARLIQKPGCVRLIAVSQFNGEERFIIHEQRDGFGDWMEYEYPDSFYLDIGSGGELFYTESTAEEVRVQHERNGDYYQWAEGEKGGEDEVLAGLGAYLGHNLVLWVDERLEMLRGRRNYSHGPSETISTIFVAWRQQRSVSRYSGPK